MFRLSALLSLSLLIAAPSAFLADCGEPTDADGDGYPADIDCDDSDPDIHPDQLEPCVCDGIDQDCSGVVDDFPCDIPCPVDEDGDGYTSDVDCDDTDPTVHPDQVEPCVCDGIDQDCNGVVDDFPCAIPCVEDADGDGYPANEDCDDTDPSIHPDQEEPCICDQIDQNCNGLVDDFPCDIACPEPGQVGDVCGQDHPACEAGLVCCYPCGIPDCDFVCQAPCDESEPWCGGGCPLVP